MLFESGVPKRLWNEAALTAVYLINRSPTKAISKNKTPAEIWYEFRPDFKKIKVFGCEASCWEPDIHRKKLDSKSKKTVFLGYVPNGYKLWNMDANKIITARDVKFQEDSFPFKSLQKMDVSTDSQIQIIYRVAHIRRTHLATR